MKPTLAAPSFPSPLAGAPTSSTLSWVASTSSRVASTRLTCPGLRQPPALPTTVSRTAWKCRTVSSLPERPEQTTTLSSGQTPRVAFVPLHREPTSVRSMATVRKTVVTGLTSRSSLRCSARKSAGTCMPSRITKFSKMVSWNSSLTSCSTIRSPTATLLRQRYRLSPPSTTHSVT